MELKPCPFCGFESPVTEIGIVFCQNCRATAGIEYWQSRPLEDVLQAKLDIAVEALEEARVQLIEIDGTIYKPEMLCGYMFMGGLTLGIYIGYKIKDV